MDTKLKDILVLSLGGLVIGGLLGVLASGAYAAWVTGGDLANIGFTTIFAFAPTSLASLVEPFRTAAMIGGGVALALTIAVPVVGVRSALTSHGSARWASVAEMRQARLLSDVKSLNGPIFGKVGTPKTRAAYLTAVKIPHSLIAAPTGAGKGVGIVTPTLLTYPGSIVCLDLKGANFETTARHRQAMGDRIFKFAPYDPEGRTHRFNPLDDVAGAPMRRRFTEARRLAASLIFVKGEGAQGFLDGARDLFAAAALLVIERDTPTIAALHDALSQPGKASANLFKLGMEVRSREAETVFNKFSSRDDKHLSAYLSVLMDGGLGLWADPMVRDATAATDFSIAELRSRPASIYIVIPPTDIVPLAPLVRLIFQQAISILQRSLPDTAKGEKYPVLLLLDEFVSLGRMDNLKTAITTLREYQVRVMIVVQTISSLRDLYGKDGAGTFLANCGMQLFMGPADEETPDYISKAIGDYTQKTRSKSWKGGELTTSYSERIESARLLRPEQVRLLGARQVVALVQNMLPILAHRVTYFEDRELNRIHRSQTGDLPEPPRIDPYDPAEAGPKEGPVCDATVPNDPASNVSAADDTAPDGDPGVSPEATGGTSSQPETIDPTCEPAPQVVPSVSATEAAGPPAPALEPSEDDPERQRREDGLVRVSADCDALLVRLEDARRKCSQTGREESPKAKAENSVSAESPSAAGAGQRSGGRIDDALARINTARAGIAKRTRPDSDQGSD